MRRLLLMCTAAVLASPALAAPPTPNVSVVSTSVDEGAPAAVQINRTGNLSQSSTIIYSTGNATAISGVNYTLKSGSVTFSKNQSAATIAVPTLRDGVVTPNLYFIVRLGVVSNALVQANGTVTVRNVDQPAPPPPVQCSDGTTVPTGQTCPTPSPTPTPVPPPTGTDNPLTGQSPGVGAPDIATTDHDVMQDLTPAAIPGLEPGGGGAFRFVCRHNSLKRDDPTVLYQQPGKSHLHDSTGAYSWGADSNYANLRQGGGSACNDVAGFDDLNQPVIANDPKVNWTANRTPYWQPALLDGKGNVILVDFTVFYYKRQQLTDPNCSDPANAQYMGKCVVLPNGIKFIFGAHPDNSSLPVDGARPDGSYSPIKFMCDKADGTIQTSFTDFAAMVQCVRGNAGAQLEVRAEAPSCWDGVNLDTADHRSHLAYGGYGSWGYYKCDAQHPYVIPSFTYAAFYTILPGDDGDIHFASDEMDNSKPRGWSFHVDYGPMAWDRKVYDMFENNCLDKLLDCSGGNLGNGFALKGAGQPIYNIGGNYAYAWRNPVRLVPVPPAN